MGGWMDRCKDVVKRPGDDDDVSGIMALYSSSLLTQVLYEICII